VRTILLAFVLVLLGVRGAPAEAPLLGEVPGGFEVRLESEATSWRIGDLMRLSVRSERTGYLLLYVLDAQGQAQIIIPGSFSEYDRVYAGQTLQIRDSRGRLMVQMGPAGVETLQAIVTRERLDALRLDPTDPAALARSLEKELLALPPRSHGQAVLHYTVDP